MTRVQESQERIGLHASELIVGEVEEFGDETFHAGVLVIDVCIEQSGLVVMRDDIVVCDGGGDQCAVTFVKGYLVTGASHTDCAIARNTHGNDKAVILAQVSMEGLGDFHHSDIEVRGVNDLSCLVFAIGVFCSIIVFYVEVKCFSG